MTVGRVISTRPVASTTTTTTVSEVPTGEKIAEHGSGRGCMVLVFNRPFWLRRRLQRFCHEFLRAHLLSPDTDNLYYALGVAPVGSIDGFTNVTSSYGLIRINLSIITEK